jgi:hypothetical protein
LAAGEWRYSVITVDKKYMLGGQVTAISGANGAYVVSTAKEGVFSGLSTMIFESATPPVGDRKLLAKLIYTKSLTKNDIRELHKELVEKLDAAVDSREMHELIANKIEEDDFFVSEQKDVLGNMDTDIGRDLILSKIDGWLVYLSMNKLLANYAKGYE